MNNNQKKLFNIVNKIEKILYDNGMTKFHKEINYSTCYIDLQSYNRLYADWTILEAACEIFIKENMSWAIELKESRVVLKIW